MSEPASPAPLPPSPYRIEIQVDEEYTAPVETANLAAAVAETLRRQGVESGQVTVVVTGDEEIAVLNQEYRGIAGPTDVLSFPAQEPDDASTPTLALPPELAAEMASYLGDIVIAYPYAARQAEHYGASIASELRLLAVHGTLHLLGFDHDTPTAERAMWAAQEEVLAAFGDHGLSERRYEE